MIEEINGTQAQSANGQNRRGYFLVSSVVMVVTLTGALIFSLFAVDLNLDMNDDIVAAVTVTANGEVKNQSIRSRLTGAGV